MSIYARNIKDADPEMQKTRALTASDGSVTSADFDLGSDPVPENLEFLVTIPALTATELASADTLTILHQGGDSASPTTALDSQVLTGTGSAIAESYYRFRPASDSGRYHNFKFTTAGTTGDMSAKSATINIVT